MKTFLPHNDELSILINAACQELQERLQTLNLDSIEIEPFFRSYFIKCHVDRVIFSLKTSAVLLYNGIQSTGKNHTEVVAMDYGAGLGTLYTLAKMIGLKKVIFNDLMPELENPAKAIDAALGVCMDAYIIGNIQTTCEALSQKRIQCDLIFSRNVLEHIYDLENFFETIHKYQPNAISYNSTTANWKNPAAHLQHIWIHKKLRKRFTQEKTLFVQSKIPNIPISKAQQLANQLLQYGGKELEVAVENFSAKNEFPKSKNNYTNLCDINGMWAEQLLPYSAYQKFAPQYEVTFKPGFWDEENQRVIVALLGKILNVFTRILGNTGVVTASFIYIICKPRTS